MLAVYVPGLDVVEVVEAVVLEREVAGTVGQLTGGHVVGAGQAGQFTMGHMTRGGGEGQIGQIVSGAHEGQGSWVGHEEQQLSHGAQVEGAVVSSSFTGSGVGIITRLQHSKPMCMMYEKFSLTTHNKQKHIHIIAMRM